MAYIGRQPTVGNFRICDAISVVNGQAAYTMQVGGVNVIPESANNMIVSLNGVIQKPGSSYTVSSSTITFSSNLSTGDVIDFIQILGGVANIGTPSDGTVTSAKLSYPLTTFSSTGIDDNATSTAVTIDSSENIGIGTTSPAGLGSNITTLEITGGSTARTGGLYLSNSDKSIKGYFYGSSSGYSIGTESNSNLSILTNNTERVRVHSDGVMSAANGIALGVGTADTASNVLDDYEEGTWTPSFIRSGSTISNVTVSKAHYTKIGRVVYISASTQYTGSDLTGVGIVGDGLPFTSAQGNSLGVTGGFIHDPGSGNTNYQAGIAGSHDSNTNFYLIITPGGRYFDTWRQNFYLSFGFWYFI